MDEKPDFYPPSEDFGLVPAGKSSRDSAPWYYTQAGQRQGPVPYSELQEKAKSGALNPRTDLVWTKGMTEWLKAGDIGDLFERAPASTASASLPGFSASPAPIADPYQPPVADDFLRAANPAQWPGARRRSFLFVTLVLPFLIQFGIGVATPFLKLPPEQLQWLGLAPGILIGIISIYFGLQRLVNLGMSRWWYLANFVPFLNFWVGYRCFSCPAGYAFHKKMDGAGIFLAIIYWLIIAVTLLLLAAFIAFALGKIGTPEMQQQFREILEQARAQAEAARHAAP
ncbi:MAG: GYF domain-containing protein [Luteolibacter sp.]